MSNHHQVVIVQVDAIERERLALDDVLGSVPIREIQEVLTSEWAGNYNNKGWQPIGESNNDFRLQLDANLAMEFHINPQDNEVVLVRNARGQFEQSRTAQGERELQANIEAHRQEYNLAFHEVVGRAMVTYLPRQVQTIPGYAVVDQQVMFQEEAHVYALEMQVNIEI